jgi:Ca2+ transporting ATPase
LILESFEDRILQILIIAATVSLVIGILQHGWEHGWVEGVSIYMAIVIIVSVTAGNNYVKEKQFQKLVTKASEDWIPTKRGGQGDYKTLPNHELLVGDVIKIESGMKVPTDCILFESTDIATDESSLTGEPEQVEKQFITNDNYEHNPNCFLYGQTLVV